MDVKDKAFAAVKYRVFALVGACLVGPFRGDEGVDPARLFPAAERRGGAHAAARGGARREDREGDRAGEL